MSTIYTYADDGGYVITIDEDTSGNLGVRIEHEAVETFQFPLSIPASERAELASSILGIDAETLTRMFEVIQLDTVDGPNPGDGIKGKQQWRCLVFEDGSVAGEEDYTMACNPNPLAAIAEAVKMAKEAQE